MLAEHAFREVQHLTDDEQRDDDGHEQDQAVDEAARDALREAALMLL